VLSLSPRPVDAIYAVEQIDAKPPLRSLRASWILRRIDWSRFDVLHAHGDDWFLWNKQVPAHVRTVHGSCLAEARHIPGLKNKFYMLWLAALETLSVCVADRTVGVSANTCRSYPWIKRVVPNGVDMTAFSPGEKESVPTILFVGTYQNRKRGKLLMDVFSRQILTALPTARLWMVCSDAPAAPQVEVLGALSAQQLADRYRRAWAFCLPSTYEGFGVPYIEAMASGTPVVASPNPGSREVLNNGEFGILAEDDELGPSLLGLLRDDAERSRLKAVGLQRAMTFSWDRVIGEYLVLYQEAISGRSCSGHIALPQQLVNHDDC